MSFLAEACAQARDRTAAAAAVEPLPALQARAAARPDPPGFAAALAAAGTAIIAEVKRASPSRGPLAAIPDAAALARAYAAGGARAVSVLTEPRHFRGSLADLEAVAAVGLPALRKDFVIDRYQVWEARAAGAAAVLLIVAALDDHALAGLLAETAAAGLDVLVEAHTAGEAARAAAAHAAAATGRPLVLGINARDMATLEVDLTLFARLRDAVPADAVAVAESGVRGPDDVRAYLAAGADAVLVGEHAATAPDPAAAVAALAAVTTAPRTEPTA